MKARTIPFLSCIFLFNVFISLQVVGANDSCLNAIQVACGQPIVGSTVGATFDSVGLCGIANTAPGVWYSFLGTGDSIAASTCSDSTNYDTKLSVFKGSCSGLICVGGNDDDICSFSGTTSRVSWLANPGTMYYILVHGFNTNVGDFELTLMCNPLSPCDTFGLSSVVSNISAIGVNDGAIDITVKGGTAPYAYSWSNGAATEDLTGLIAGTYSATVVSSDSCVAIDTISVGPPNDDCQNAQLLVVHPPDSCSGNETLGTTAGATSEGADPSCDLGGLPQDVWYTFNSGNNTEILLSINLDSNSISSFEIFNACGSADTSISPNCDLNIGGDLQQLLTGFPGIPTTYYIRVWSSPGYGDTPGTFEICLSEVPEPCVVCSPISMPEGEPCGASFNNGCNMAVPTFQPIIPGTPVCGTAWADVIRDTDWFTFSLAHRSNVVWGAWAEFPVSLVIGDTSAGCVANLLSFVSSSSECDTVVIDTILGPGNYFAFIAPLVFTGYPCGTLNNYEAILIVNNLCDSFQLSFNVTDVSTNGGNDGAIDLTVSGGTPPYSYHWSTGASTEDISGLSAGTYFVTVASSDNCSTIDSVVVDEPSCVTQNIAINSGWNMISSYINPDDPDMGAVFSAIVTDVLLVKNTLGLTLIPAFGINQIGNWNLTEGYKVKASTATTLTMGCDLVDPASTPISLGIGWSIIAYLRNTPMDVAQALSTIELNLSLAKDNLGKTYIPAFGINQIGNMEPGQGYKVKMTDTATLIYPANAKVLPEVNYIEPRKPVHYALNMNTGYTATIIVLENSLGETLSIGDEIGVFNEGGKLTGAAVYEGNNLAINVWGDDLTTGSEIEGMLLGQDFKFRIWKSAEQKEWIAKVIFEEGDEFYVNDGITVLKRLSIEGQQEENPIIHCYPNPSAGFTYFEIELVKASNVVLKIYDVTGRMISRVVDQELPSGNHQFTFDSSHLPDGRYNFSIVVNEASKSGSFVKIR